MKKIRRNLWAVIGTLTTLVVIIIVLVGCARSGTLSQPTSTVSTTNSTEQPSTATIPFTTIAQEAPIRGHPTESLYTVVSQPEEWDELRDILPDKAIEAGIQSGELENSLIVVAFAGIRSTGGYSITIESISQQYDQIIIIVSETTPGGSGIATDANTLPYHLVALPRKNLPSKRNLTFVFYDSQGDVLNKKKVKLP